MMQVVNCSNPPLRLVLGADAVEAVHAKLEAVATDLAAWRNISTSTAFAGVTVGTIGG